MRGTTAIVFALIAAFAATSTVARASDGHSVPGARELEGRLIAPCCWTQTLDIHDSAIAEELRAEVRKRLQAGEPAAKIEDDLAARYGERIRAVPRGEDPRVALPLFVFGAMALAVLWFARLGVAWLRRSRSHPALPAAAVSSSQAHYDQRLDDELKQLSDVS